MVKLDLKLPPSVLGLLQALRGALGPDFQISLAGGFLRDTFGGARIKDIDVLVSPMNEGFTFNGQTIIDALDRACIPDWIQVTESLDATYLSGMQARGVKYLFMGKCPNRDNQETQLIVYDKVMGRKELAKDMDINICQIACDPDGNVVASEEFVDGFNKQYIQVLNGESDDREVERVQRMQGKYPEFRILPARATATTEFSFF